MNNLVCFVNSHIKQMFVDHILDAGSALSAEESAVKRMAKITPCPPGAYYLVLDIVFHLIFSGMALFLDILVIFQ